MISDGEDAMAIAVIGGFALGVLIGVVISR